MLKKFILKSASKSVKPDICNYVLQKTKQQQKKKHFYHVMIDIIMLQLKKKCNYIYLLDYKNALNR